MIKFLKVFWKNLKEIMWYKYSTKEDRECFEKYKNSPYTFRIFERGGFTTDPKETLKSKEFKTHLNNTRRLQRYIKKENK